MKIKKAGQVSLFVVVAVVLVAGIILIEFLKGASNAEIENKKKIDRCERNDECVADSCFATSCTTVGEMPNFDNCPDIYIDNQFYENLNVNIQIEYRKVGWYNTLCPADKRKQLLCGYYGECKCLNNKCVAVFP